MYYAAKYIHADGRKVNCYVYAEPGLTPGTVREQWNGDKIIIEFAFNEQTQL